MLLKEVHGTEKSPSLQLPVKKNDGKRHADGQLKQNAPECHLQGIGKGLPDDRILKQFPVIIEADKHLGGHPVPAEEAVIDRHQDRYDHRRKKPQDRRQYEEAPHRRMYFFHTLHLFLSGPRIRRCSVRGPNVVPISEIYLIFASSALTSALSSATIAVKAFNKFSACSGGRA